jgi:hypothetical protein
MEVSGQPHAPAVLLLAKVHSVPIELDVSGAPEPAWAFCRRANSLTPAGTRTPYHPTCSLVTVPTTISRVHFLYNKPHGWKLGVLLLYISALHYSRGEEEENNVPSVPRESTGRKIAVLNRQICPNLK